MLLNRLAVTAFVACVALSASTALAATTPHRIHVSAQNVPDGVSPDLVDSLLVEAEHRLEQFRIDASSGSTSVPSIKAEQSVTLQRQRVKVSIDWRDPGSGRSGRAYALPQADPFSFFYYDDPINSEIFVKVLDFGSTTPFLIFYAGLTSFEYTVTFENVCTGQKVVKFKPGGSAEGGFDNTSLSWCDPQGPAIASGGVNSFNGATGDVTLTGSGNAAVSRTGNIINVNVPTASGGVPSVNGIASQPVIIAGVGGTSVSTAAGTITISSQAGSGSDASVLPPIFAVGATVTDSGGNARLIQAIQGGWIAFYRASNPKVLSWQYVPAQAVFWTGN